MLLPARLLHPWGPISLPPLIRIRRAFSPPLQLLAVIGRVLRGNEWNSYLPEECYTAGDMTENTTP